MNNKEFNKFLKTIKKDERFHIIKSRRKNTLKIIHVEKKVVYTVHPADHAIKPIKRWINKFNNKDD